MCPATHVAPLDAHPLESLPSVEPGYSFSKVHTFDVEQAKTFALAAGDTNPLHHDEVYAKSTRFGGLIVGGTHTTSLLMGLSASHLAGRGSVVGMGYSIDLLRPVKVDESIELEWVVIAKSHHNDSWEVLELEGMVKGNGGQLKALGRGRVLFKHAA